MAPLTPRSSALPSPIRSSAEAQDTALRSLADRERKEQSVKLADSFMHVFMFAPPPALQHEWAGCFQIG